MVDVILLVASFPNVTVSVRYDDVTLRIDRVLVNNQSVYPLRAAARHRVTGNMVWVTCNAGQNRSFNVPAGYYLGVDPEDGSLNFGDTEVYCQFPGDV